jgi:hypothetical protein
MKYKIILLILIFFLNFYLFCNEKEFNYASNDSISFFNAPDSYSDDIADNVIIGCFKTNTSSGKKYFNISFSINFFESSYQNNLQNYFSSSYWRYFDTIYEDIKRYDVANKENPFRRASILFFGALTFATFGGWLFMSIFNVLIYGDVFGNLRRDQFLLLYLGSSIISISVVLSDLFVNLSKKKYKIIEFY